MKMYLNLKFQLGTRTFWEPLTPILPIFGNQGQQETSATFALFDKEKNLRFGTMDTPQLHLGTVDLLCLMNTVCPWFLGTTY